MIEKFARLIPEELKDKSGSVFYSGRNAFTGKKNLYILGLNPGGSEIRQKDETIDWHTNNVLTKKPDNWSEYKDESWEGHIPGTYGLQPRILHLLNKVGLSPYEVPSSNVCFVRSPREKHIANKLNLYIELCWAFHENVIKELDTKVILCFGKKAGNVLIDKLQAFTWIDEFVEKNYRKWSTQVYRNNNGQTVIIATHPSIADWTNPDSDPSELVKEVLIT